MDHKDTVGTHPSQSTDMEDTIGARHSQWADREDSMHTHSSLSMDNADTVGALPSLSANHKDTMGTTPGVRKTKTTWMSPSVRTLTIKTSRKPTLKSGQPREAAISSKKTQRRDL